MSLPSKAWDWNVVESDFWTTPAEEAFYLAERWKSKKYKTVLDLGCGLGRHSLFFARHGFAVSAFDLSHDGIEKWRSDAQELGIDATVGDMRSLPYPDASFDCVFAMHTIYHADTDSIGKIISEMQRVLKPHGEFFVTMCSKSTPRFLKGAYRMIDSCTVIKDEPPEKDVPHYYVNLDELKALFSAFRLDTIRHTEECMCNGCNPGISWHYFVLGDKSIQE